MLALSSLWEVSKLGSWRDNAGGRDEGACSFILALAITRHVCGHSILTLNVPQFLRLKTSELRVMHREPVQHSNSRL